jgi:CheY-like chemotaxis protein
MMTRVQDANQGLIREIAERRRIEAERENLLVRERQASRVKDEFLAAVSHELRTPLNAILGWVQILKMGPPDPDTTNKAMATIARNAQAQARLIEDLVDVSRIVTGKLHLRFEAIDLRVPVEAAAEVVRSAARAKNVSLELKLPASTCIVNGDNDRLQQIVSNLLSNAIKFSPAGGTIAVTLEPIDGAYDIRVTDRGIGIAKEFLPHVFERFSQSDASMTREHGGLGLGLAIVKELTELHDGSVTAESPGLGHGATFTVRLPALVRLDVAAAGTVPGQAPPAQTLSGVRVLAVDDNIDALEIVSAALTAAGAQVAAVTSGADAIVEWRRQPYDVLICDLAMPQMNGFDVMRHLRRSDESIGRQTVAIALSAHASADYVQRCYEAGFVQHLSKPFATSELVRAVASAVPQMKE